MKLRYDFDSSQKTYRTFPQRMVQSTGLADRWSFLKWCCPFCLDKPKARSRTSSGVPVIRITRPRSPDSDIESDEELEWQRNSGRNTDSTVQSPRDNGWNEPGGDAGSVTSSIGSGELENIDEEHKYYREDDNDRDSVWSKSSIRSKDSIKSKASVTDSLKSKSSQKNKRNKDSKKNSKGSRDSIVDKDSNKTRSPMKKIFKQLKRTTSSGSTSSADSRGDDHTPLKSVSRRDDGRKGGAKRPVSAFDGKWRSMTMSNSRTQDKEIQRSSFSEYRSQTMKTSARGAHDAQERDDEVFFSDSRGHHTSSGGREPKEAPGSPNSRPRKYHAHEGNKAEVRDGKINSGSKNSEKNVDRNSISSATPAESTEKESLRALAKCEPPENGDREMEHNPWPGSHEIQLSSAKIVLPKKQHQHHQQQQDQKEQQRQQQQHLQQQQEQHQQQQHQQKQKQQAYQEHPTPSTTPSPQHSSPSPLEDETSVGGEDSGGGGGGGGGGAGGGGEMSATPGGGGGGGGMGLKSGSPSPLVGSVGRISGRDSVASLTSSTDTSCLTHPDEDIERLLQLNEKKISSLTPLGSRSESMASVCSAGAEGRYGTVIIRGEIELGLQYNYKEGQLEVHVAQCRDLAAVDTKRNRSDPYVKVYLLPDKSKSGKRKTKVKKHTLNPVFEDVLKFSTTMSELESRTLWVSVWHSDMFGRNDFLGEVVISLADTVFDDVSPKWYPLQDRIEPLEELSYSPRGDLILALKFVPPDAVSSKKARRSRGALHVLVKEAKSLAAVRAHGTADPICKGLLLPEKGKASKQKTSVCRKTLNPTWNHTLVFDDTSLQELTERALELSVWDHDRLGPSHFLGGCRLSLGKGNHGGRPVEWMEAAGMEVKLWEQMLDRPNLWVEGSIMLRTTMDKPIYSSSMTE